MRYCRYCKIDFKTPLDRCLFCNNALDADEDKKEAFRYPPIKKESHAIRNLLRVFIFLVLLANTICLYLDYTTGNPGMGWSWIVLSVSLYVLLLLYTVTRNSYWQAKVIGICLLTVAEVLSIGFLTGGSSWALSYLFPFSIMALELFAISLLVGRKQKLYEASIYVFLLTILGLLPFVFRRLNLLTVHWPSITSCFFSGITLFGLFFFGRKEFIEELRRRFYV